MPKVPGVYWSALQSGKLALFNLNDDPATVRLPGGRLVAISPDEIALE